MCTRKSYFLIAALIAILFAISCSLNSNQDFLKNDALLLKERCILGNKDFTNIELVNYFLNDLERRKSKNVVNYLFEDITWIVAGDPAKVPFAGTYTNRSEVFRYLQNFYRNVKITDLVIVALTEPHPNYLEAYIRMQGKTIHAKKTFDIEFLYTWQLNAKQRIEKITVTYPLISMELAFKAGGKANIVADLNFSEEAMAITNSFLPLKDFINTLTYEQIKTIIGAPVVPDPLPEDGTYELVNINGIPGEIVSVNGNVTDKIILQYHGGAFIIGSAAEMRPINYEIAKLTNIPVLSIDYALAAENPFPAGLNDCYTVYEELLNTYAAVNIALWGTSAGGNFVMSTILLAKRNNLPLPGAAICFSPWLDITNSGETFITNYDADTLLTKTLLDRCAEWYLTDISVSPDNPLVSPLFGDISDFPPVYLTASTSEVLLSDSTRMFTALANEKVDVTIEIASNLLHVWPGYMYYIEDGMRTIARVSNFIKDKLN